MGVRQFVLQTYGVRLLRELYECFLPMPYEAARQMEMEMELADELQDQAYPVWPSSVSRPC